MQYDMSKSSNVVMFRVFKHVHLQQCLLHHDLKRKRKSERQALAQIMHINYEHLQWQCRVAGSVHQENKIPPTATMPSEDFPIMGNACARIIQACLVLQKDVKLLISCQKCSPYKSSQLNNIHIYKTGLNRCSCPQSAGKLKSLSYALDHRGNSRNCS